MYGDTLVSACVTTLEYGGDYVLVSRKRKSLAYSSREGEGERGRKGERGNEIEDREQDTVSANLI